MVTWAGIGLGYLLALWVTVLSLSRAGAGLDEVLGSIALGVAISLAPALALISLDRRPGLLPAASLTAVLLAVIDVTLFPFLIPLALIWVWAHRRRPLSAEVGRGLWWARVAMALGAVLAVFTLFAHLDPSCTETLEDGTVNEVDPALHGYGSGWRFGPDLTDEADDQAIQSGPDGVVSSKCTSDTIVWGEALASILISLTVVAAGLRWPVNPSRPATPLVDSRT
jgi:hypothetical protein